ncbi:dihydroorotase family protein [Streptomyces nogalater]|uniref:Dihydroorotase family protein n=1 Tax=Streptomyces nogalater TaxID=38314 RepID=A0ABW0WFI5_STRNO
MEHLTSYDLLVTNARLVTPEGVRTGALAVAGGRIARILSADAPLPAATRTLDAAGRYVLPGVIDSHVHFRTPGLTHKETWHHGSRAAAAGGVTTVIDMPNTEPPLHSLELAYAKAEMISGQSLVDYRFHFGVREDTVDVLRDLTPRVATSVKVFMTGHHTAPSVIRDPAVLDRIFAVAAERDLRLVLHAEDDGVFSLLDTHRPAPDSYGAYEPHRPRSGGIVAVAKVIDLVRRHGTAAHVLHVSSAEESDMLSAAGAAGLPVTYETTPHHLSFTASDTRRLGARIRLSPAIREERDQECLWRAVVSDQITTLGSDHAPHTPQEKVRPAPDAPPGLPGVQELLTAVFTGLVRRFPHVPLDDHMMLLSRLCAARPAALFGLDERKGALTEGRDADFVVFDPSANWLMSSREAHTKNTWSAYEGWTFTGHVDLTVRRGAVIWDSHDFGDPDGQWLDARPLRLHTARPATV